jgi:hypothetical protein
MRDRPRSRARPHPARLPLASGNDAEFVNEHEPAPLAHGHVAANDRPLHLTLEQPAGQKPPSLLERSRRRVHERPRRRERPAAAGDDPGGMPRSARSSSTASASVLTAPLGRA